MKNRTLILTMSILAVTLVWGHHPGFAQKNAEKQAESTEVSTQEKTPEQVVRAFFIALINNDATALRSHIMPVSQADLALLTSGKRLSADDRKQFAAHFATVSITRVKPGSEYYPPDGTARTIPKDLPGVERVYLLPEDAPIPIRLVKVDGKWLVDTKPMLAGRKAAVAARDASGAYDPTLDKRLNQDTVNHAKKMVTYDPTSFRLVRDAEGIWIQGVIKNKTDKFIPYLEATFAVMDKKGAQIYVATANDNNIQPKASWKFKAYVMGKTAKKFKLLKVSTTSLETPQVLESPEYDL